MKVIATRLPDVLVIEPKVFGDDRGFSTKASMPGRLPKRPAAPCSSSRTTIHAPPGACCGPALSDRTGPGKTRARHGGEVLDVAVDIRRSSPTFGQWTSVRLSAQNHRQMWVPPGFAHGFVVLSESADFLYKTTDYYAPSAERCIRWDDPQLAIDWELEGAPVLSAKDQNGKPLHEADLFP